MSSLKMMDSARARQKPASSLISRFRKPSLASKRSVKIKLRQHRSDGTKTDTTYNSTYDALILDSDGLTAGTGEYAFADTLDLEAVYSLDLERRLVARGIYPADLWDSRTANIDTWLDIDGGVVDQVNAELYVRKTNDDPSGTPTYTAWQPLANGILKGRAFQFKIVDLDQRGSKYPCGRAGLQGTVLAAHRAEHFSDCKRNICQSSDVC